MTKVKSKLRGCEPNLKEAKPTEGIPTKDIAKVIAAMPKTITTLGMAELIYNMIQNYDMQDDFRLVATIVVGALEGEFETTETKVRVKEGEVEE